MQIMKCQDFVPKFLFLRNLLFLGHITNVLVGLFNRNTVGLLGLYNRNMVGQWAYLMEIRFVRFLTMHSALFCHLMVIFTYARPVERN